MTWNILMGGADRLDAVLDLITRENPDVLVLHECLGWESGTQLVRLAAALGVPTTMRHTLLGIARPRGSGAQYHVALLSRFPIARWRTHADPQRIGHVILEADIGVPGGTVKLLGTHFDSHGEDERLRDAATLLEIVGASGDRTAVVGDLNALSRQDPYPDDLDRLLLGAKTTKYGNPARYETIELIEESGLVDLLWTSGEPEGWVTAVRERNGVRIEYRTHYIFASRALSAQFSRASIIDVGEVSDHNALVVEFDALRKNPAH